MPPEVLHLAQIAGFLRSVPSPEQGTSHKTRSKNGEPFAAVALSSVVTMLGKFWPLCVDTTNNGELMRLHWCTNMYALSVSASFATTRPCLDSSSGRERLTISSSCEVLLPGAAHISKHRW
jgi:hypothetical protein